MRTKALAAAATVALFAGGVLAALPAYTGHQARQALAELGDSRFGDLHIKHRLDASESGYLRSRAEASVQLSAGGESVRFEVVHHIRHRLTGAVVESDFRIAPLPDAEQQALLALFPAGTAFRTVTTTTPGGALIELSVPAVDFTDSHSQFTLRSAPLSGKLQLKGDGAEAELRLPSVRLQGETAGLLLENQRLRFHSSDHRDSWSDGTAGYRAERITLTDADSAYSAKAVEADVVQTRSGSLLNAALAVHVETLTAPQGTLAGLRARLAVANLEQDLLTLLAESEPQAWPDAAFKRRLTAFMANSPRLELQAAVGSPAPSASLEWMLGYRHRSEAQVDLKDWLALLAALEAESRLELSDEGLKHVLGLDSQAGALQVQLQLTEAVNNGLLLRRHDGYSGTLSLRDGSLLVNGSPRPDLVMLLGLVLMGLGV